MKPVRILAVALLGYAAALVPSVSQAHSSVSVFLPGISVRLPAPPLFLPPLPGVSVREVGYDRDDYRREYREMPTPRYYREDWRHERHDDRFDRRDRGDRFDHHDRDDHRDHGRNDGRR